MNFISGFFSHFVQPDLQTALLVVVNLILIESLLSIDNAAVLATMVKDLPQKSQQQALRIGIVFAYIFRGLTLVFASWVIKFTWLKFLGGAYLIYLSGDYLLKKILVDQNTSEADLPETPKHTKFKLPGLNYLWSTVITVEIMDLIFSIDNVFAAVAFTNNIYLICLGVFIGIITMRIVAGYFVKLMNLFPFLETLAFIIIGILGIRLCSDFICGFFGENMVCKLMHGEKTDFFFSILTAAIFFLPIISSLLFNFPKRDRATKSAE